MCSFADGTIYFTLGATLVQVYTCFFCLLPVGNTFGLNFKSQVTFKGRKGKPNLKYLACEM